MLLQTETADIESLLLIVLGSASFIIVVLLTIIFIFLNTIRKKNEKIGKLQHKISRLMMEEKFKELTGANEKDDINS
jgi:hypothetical protein